MGTLMGTVKMGVIGCGAIAQVHHMPNLSDLPDLFEVTAVCDVSRGAADYVAKKFHVPQAFTDYRELLAADVDAVLLCHSDPKTQVAVDAFGAAKHVFIEKPMCFSRQEADRIIAAHEQAGTVGQVGYMKVFDPAYEVALREVQAMDDIRFVQVNHLHPDNGLHVRQFDVRKFDDIPQDAMAKGQAARRAADLEAIGDVPKYVSMAFHLMSGSMIHDLYGMRMMLGVPNKIVSSEIWLDGRAVTMTLEYPNGARCVASWVDLPNLWDFKETLEVYGDDKRVIVAYPTGFSRGILSTVTIQGIDDQGMTYRQEPAIDWESAFVREMRHFHDCIVNGTACRTPVESAKADIGFIIDVIENYKERVLTASHS
jgi:predicted dehydrogenase